MAKTKSQDLEVNEVNSATEESEATVDEAKKKRRKKKTEAPAEAEVKTEAAEAAPEKEEPALSEEEMISEAFDAMIKRSNTPINSASKTAKKKLYKSEKVITEDGDEEIETEATIRRNEFIELSASAKAHRVLSGKIVGMHISEAYGQLFVEVAYGQQSYSVLIPVSLLFDYDEKEYEGEEGRNKLESQVRRRYGATIRFVVRKVDEKNQTAIASRLEALQSDGLDNYVRNWMNDDQPRIVNDMIVKSKIVAVSRNYIVVDALGAEIRIGKDDLSYNYIGDAREEFSVGMSINVRVNDIQVVSVQKRDMTYRLVKATGSVKATMPDNRKALYDSFKVGGKYAATVTYLTETSVFVQLKDSYDCICAFPKYGIMPEKGQKRVVEITAKQDADMRIFGIMSSL